MEDNNETGRANLEGLPTELFQMVASNLSGKRLKCLRLVSRSASVKVFYVYKKKLFSDYGFLLFNPDNMSRALKVAKDPEFAKSIQKLSVSCSYPTMQFGEPENDTETQIVQQAIVEADAFKERDGPLSCLTTLLCYLKQHGNLKEVEIMPYFGEREQRLLDDAFIVEARPIRERSFFVTNIHEDFDGALNTITEAVSLAEMKLSKLTMRPGEITAQTISSDHCLSTFQRLESLTIESIELVGERIAVPQYVEWLLVKQAPQLKSLCMSSLSEFPYALRSTRFPLLETVTIVMESEAGLGEGPRMEALIDFVKLNPSLVSFNLVGVDILNCHKHFPIDEEYREANHEDYQRLQEILGVPGAHRHVELYP